MSQAPHLTDAAGVRHRATGAEARIVSLVPSLTETLFDLGLGNQVVGRTAFCVHPRGAVRAARSVGGTKTVNMENLRALRPTHAIVNVDETPRALAEQLAAEGLVVIVTHPIQVHDNLALYRLLGGVFGRDAEAARLCRRFEAVYDHLAARQWPPRRVLYLIWKDPWMTVSRDTYISRMLALAGMETGVWPDRDRYPKTDLEPETLARVDTILLATEPFPFKESHRAELRESLGPAGPPVRLVDGEMISWYGSRAIAGLEYLAQFATED